MSAVMPKPESAVRGLVEMQDVSIQFKVKGSVVQAVDTVSIREEGSTTRRVFEQELKERGVEVQLALEMGSRESVREAVAQGLGLGVVAETAYGPDPRLAKLAISDTRMATQVHFICRKERHHAPLISTFLGLAHSVGQTIA